MCSWNGRQWFGQRVAACLMTRPLREPMPIFCRLDLQQDTSGTLNLNFDICHVNAFKFLFTWYHSFGAISLCGKHEFLMCYYISLPREMLRVPFLIFKVNFPLLIVRHGTRPVSLMLSCDYILKQKVRDYDIFIIGCTRCCHVDNFQSSQWRKVVNTTCFPLHCTLLVTV